MQINHSFSNMDKIKLKLDKIVTYLNDRFAIDSEEYDYLYSANPLVISYNDEVDIALWACGAVVNIEDMIYFISENDGNWSYTEESCDPSSNYAYLTPFSIGWAKSIAKAINALYT